MSTLIISGENQEEYSINHNDIIGEGIFGVVIQGIKESNGNYVAIKAMFKSDIPNSLKQDGKLKEYLILNIVRFPDVP